MASKGQKFNSYSPEIKQEILDKYFSNLGSASSLAKEYCIPCKTIKNWIYKHKQGKNVLIEKAMIAEGAVIKDNAIIKNNLNEINVVPEYEVVHAEELKVEV